MLGVGLLLTIGTGLFVASEFALVNLDRADLEARRERGESRLALTISALKITSTHLSSAQLGITLTTLLTGYTMEPAISSLLAPVLGAWGVPSALVSPIAVFVGVDDLILESSVLGIDGWVAGSGIAFPRENQHFWDLTRAQRWDEAREMYQWFYPLLKLDTHVKFVQYIKLAVQEVGLGAEWVRAPRMTLTGDERRRVLSIIHAGIETRPPLLKGWKPGSLAPAGGMRAPVAARRTIGVRSDGRSDGRSAVRTSGTAAAGRRAARR